ncbi:SIMPL domain-containing protein [Halobacillus karajensis]|uniref:26 kDa periplasmic immunogenic protein n=1 Tax=Halobacillus karajensis TaxID=195088 RepID=A0A024P8L8_9BACI|nr:SIMPL domain-containing protein [Halobacillus karajensis]CDQ20082.1 26 kDa periplasmic immunogenic protein precursor [Halobacillus karajensis]CDQ25255.1 26 kDa periplasmic immunogenic protein precursor [Halobacillus karajensis]CDQ28384.1 26 kDa periplasmic immunogenic protein precursor [Halobacillus karajensis]
MYYQPVRQAREGESRLLKVNGTGKVHVRPDVVNVNIGAVTQDMNLEKAQQENAQIMEQVRTQLMAAGVPEDHIQTADYFIFPEYDYVDGQQVFRGYQVTHTFNVTIEDVSQTGYIIDTAVANGANRISNFEFTVKDPYQNYQDALKVALRNAGANAQTIASTLGLNLDPTPVKIKEIDSSPAVPMQSYQKSEGLVATATPIEPGTLETVARVEAHFQYFS